jgi:hypothetical protein
MGFGPALANVLDEVCGFLDEMFGSMLCAVLLKQLVIPGTKDPYGTVGFSMH